MAVFFEKEFMHSVSELYKNAVLTASELADDIGLPIFLIGGIVRDLILGNEIKDVDIVVQGDAVAFCLLLEERYSCEILNIQENLRTAKVQFSNGAIIDFASTRQEKYINSGVLPVAYDFGCDLKLDVQRRDFTINTLALKLVGNEKFSLIDYCGGFDDIQNKKIKILHNKSFIDDPSRIVRALKFKIRFSFDFDKETYFLMQKYLENVSPDMPLERIKGELKQYFSINKEGLYDTLLKTNIYKLISDSPLKRINNCLLDNLEFSNTEKAFVYLVLLILYSNFSIERYNLTASEKKILKEIRGLLEKEISCETDDFSIYKTFSGFSDMSLDIYYIITSNKLIKKYKQELKNYKINLNGDDLISLGLRPSPYFNKIFDILLKEKINGKIKTKDDEINFVKTYIKKEE